MRRLVVVAAGLWVAAAGAAVAQDSVQAFTSFCLETGARSAPALRAAEVAGWQPMPSELAAELGTLVEVRDPIARVKYGAATSLVLLTGSSPEEGDGLVGEHCNVFMFGGAPMPDASARIGAWIGLPAVVRQDMSQWQYVEDGGRRVALAEAPDRVVVSYGVITLSRPDLTRHEVTRLENVAK